MQTTQENKNLKKVKFIDKANQGVYSGVLNGTKFKIGHYFVFRQLLYALALFFVSGKHYPANNSGLDFQKYITLVGLVKGFNGSFLFIGRVLKF